MQGAIVGGIYFLACLLSLGVKSQNVLNSQDRIVSDATTEQASQLFYTDKDTQGELEPRSSARANPSASSENARDYGTKESTYNYAHVDPKSPLAKALAGAVTTYGNENFKSDSQTEKLENDSVSNGFDYKKTRPESLSQIAANNEQLGFLSSGSEPNNQFLSREDTISRSAQEEDEDQRSHWGGTLYCIVFHFYLYN
ncbi:uncharacterized protein LOC124538863 [Vanessa cardui]|uniref:uncharacterized protein LOC124538863 n=1 Tax=Vanessa cardui TaxID=171605 RepID=UPI001F130FF3|nr:uncharacterized protein LOC124538863 [Vanessa cardui]